MTTRIIIVNEGPDDFLAFLWCPLCKKNIQVSERKCPQKCPMCGVEIQAEWQ